MKKQLTIIFLGTLLSAIACRQEAYPDGFDKNLPFGFSYHISRIEAESIIDSLVNNNVFILPYNGSSSYEYDLSLSNGVIKLSVTPKFYNDSLYSIDIREARIINDKSEKENYKNAIDLFKFNEIDLNSYNTNRNNISKTYEWSKQGYKISLYPDDSFIIIFSDNYISDRLLKASSDKVLKEAIERNNNSGGVKVQNSTWDGSIRQVEAYLKKTLKDPKSYESIEWSEVSKTDNGYVVRHKFRAKNSFGGYTIENKVFYLNSSGDVTEVQNY